MRSALRWWLSGAWLLILAVIIFCADRRLAQPFFAFVQQTPGADKAGHFILIGLFAFFLNLSLRCREIRIAGSAVLLGSVIVLALAAAEEFSQLFIRARSFDLLDFAADAAGIAAFGWLARRWSARVST